MQDLSLDELGSWRRAVVTSGGVWQTRGSFSKKWFFYSVNNHLTGGLLWCGHKCMRGKDDVVEEDLYQGTAKSMQGVLEEECYEQAKNEGSKVEVVWQDGESSTAKSITLHHPAGKAYKCGEQFGRAQSNHLKEADLKTKYKAKFPKLKL